MDGGIEHPAHINAGDRSTVHADADEATRELVHDHEHPVAPEHDRLASKEVHAPEAVGGMADERLRDLSSTMAWTSNSSGPVGPGFFGHGVDENSRRYLPRTKA